MVYPPKTYGLSSPTLQLSSNGLSLLSPLAVRPRLDTFRLVFSKNCHFFTKISLIGPNFVLSFLFPSNFKIFSFIIQWSWGDVTTIPVLSLLF